MKSNGKNLMISSVWVILGLLLLGLSAAGKLDSFWSGMGGGLTAIGALQLLRQWNYRKNADYREKVDISTSDERNRFLVQKAWSSAAISFLLLSSLAIVVLHFCGAKELQRGIALSLGVLILLYWAFYLYFKKKF